LELHPRFQPVRALQNKFKLTTTKAAKYAWRGGSGLRSVGLGGLLVRKSGVMRNDEIILLLRASVDKTVKITYANGEIDMALVRSADDEGVVYDLASIRPEDRKTEYWTAFSEIVEVQPTDLPEHSK
jgi:hypothetical protein